jgi:hypothetical protein
MPRLPYLSCPPRLLPHLSAADPPSPFVWIATRPSPLPHSTDDPSYAAALRIDFTNTLHLVPCAPTTQEILSPKIAPLTHLLPLVNRQIYVETAGIFWGANTLVLPDYAAGREVLEYLGPASKGIQRVELAIGNVWDVGEWQGWQVKMMLHQLERLVHDGALKMVRLKYMVGVSGDGNTANAFKLWFHILREDREESDWRGCKRELVMEDKTGLEKSMRWLAHSWRLEDAYPLTPRQWRMIRGGRNW